MIRMGGEAAVVEIWGRDGGTIVVWDSAETLVFAVLGGRKGV